MAMIEEHRSPSMIAMFDDTPPNSLVADNNVWNYRSLRRLARGFGSANNRQADAGYGVSPAVNRVHGWLGLSLR